MVVDDLLQELDESSNNKNYDISSDDLKSEFNGDISKWDVSSLISMQYMFHTSCFNGDISNWNISNVRDMTNTFHSCRAKPNWYKKEIV